MFNQLLGVNGIGPKAALGILSFLTPDDLRMAIIAEDAKAIAKAPGIGPKTAKRVILDLKDKISMDDVLPLQFAGGPAEANVAAAASGVDGAGKEAIEALVALGYSPTEATKAVRQVEIKEGMNAEAVLKASLKFLAFKIISGNPSYSLPVWFTKSGQACRCKSIRKSVLEQEMERRIITTEVTEEDKVIEPNLRPQLLDEYIGQAKNQK